MAQLHRREFLAAQAVLASRLAFSSPQPQAGQRNLLTSTWPVTMLTDVLAPRGRFHPFPTVSERPAWEGLPADTRTALVEVGTLEEIPIEDSLLRHSWGERLYRILLHANPPPLRSTWTLRITQ
jgi:hypothetical protein